ncbi:unnamed protein product [Allacma fusca]|uniref:F-box domain-containing protein n=1 Tax=Allacma fusca TaxID=39272 RepID=A0A8J2P596_9HEXA|nr:unnamed protein product [Allacma fusca]
MADEKNTLEVTHMQTGVIQSYLEPENTDLGGFSEETLLNPLILKKILLYLPISDLFITSVVCRHWNIFSREILRERKVLARIESEHPCTSLRELIALLAHSENVPFSGLSIETPWWGPHHSQFCFDEDILPHYVAETLSKINVKYLSISISQYFKCVSVDFICKIVQACSRQLEELHLHFVTFDHKFSEILRIEPRILWLPNVKILGLTTFKDQETENLRRNTVTELIKATPKIQEFDILIYPSFLEFIPGTAIPAVKHFCFRPNLATLGSVLEFAQRGPILKSLKFGTVLDEELNDEIYSPPRMEQIGQILRLLLKSGRDSLNMFATDHLNLILMTSSFRNLRFSNVEKLILRYGRFIDNIEGYPTLLKLDWAMHFPNLKEVCITDSKLDCRCRSRYIKDHFRQFPGQYSCVTVTKLTLVSSELIRDARQLPMFRDLFPNVKIFSFQESFYINLLMSLWTTWPDLEEIVVQLGEPYVRNFDSIIVGISEEEVKHLLEQDLDLELLQVVPTRPSLQNLTKLKKLTVILSPHSKSKCNQLRSKNRSGISLTRLSGLCGFSRLPELQVEIHRDLCSENCQFEIRDLEQFVNFQNRRESCRPVA